ncbi:MAG TPA: 3-phosphoshikimate 1-carboxyvinyltransferase [Balneolaceae bacterium]|nr:3-phosphoshikimate 1-carboxyvinyltransferase [Balneolaceae bacterium]
MTESIQPALTLRGALKLPADKSISHRSALFAAISEETSTITNYSDAADPHSTLDCLEALGVEIERDGNKITIQGVGRDGFKTPDRPLDCGNSGTTMRLLAGMVAGAGTTCTLIGDESLTGRTMKRIIQPLRSMGCAIEAREDEFAPLRFESHNGVEAIRYSLPIASAQLKSAVLLAGLYGEDTTEVIETLPSRDHTERLLGLVSEEYETGRIIRSSRKDLIPPQNYAVPGDFSAAAFWLTAGAIHRNAEIVMEGVGINPTRTAAMEILEQMGADITRENISAEEGREPTADIVVRSSDLKGIAVNPAVVPNCIDELPILMVAMCFADGESIITGAGELRHKETDRLDAMGQILNLAGAEFELQEDGIVIQGNPDFIPRAAEYPSYHDHRMAMAAAVLATRSRSQSTVLDAECTAISYPGFWDHLRRISVLDVKTDIL